MDCPKLNSSVENHTIDYDDKEMISKNYEKNDESNYAICRICLCSSASDENPLLSLCKCTGSLKYCHYECLNEWLASRIKEKTSSCFIFLASKNLTCEICKEKFPISFEYKNKTMQLIKLEQGQKSI